MTVNLKASDELIIAATGISIVYTVFAQGVPNYSDVRADQTGNTNTFKSTKMAAITSVAIIGTIALIARSPTVFTIGGAAILLETWKYHYANHAVNGTQDNNVNGVVG